ncbi:hypothetical protein E2C00_09635 [Streptomyces sp. WAC05374]|uniref:hypothetical protein n=1 Tax=Streptomyces sp. WAC05374 TaxID=2487420 RepID=UPI000F8631F3|nr:hypothetical protein [Streptomyces sp. WAC05374]RST13420.1 hypothetical protein EF905_20395 [Streptomyces sp. WAC05374]TDF47059.1 hypothetical protein E2B92_08465 [Streptomyces sp. WAC05374]TDF57315.1 hypothetical protein E2C00_09635 [Streptomyces sp. WAC05374]TDF61420.1 hypothetical protein E2C02_00835 [Streptomyces sp. WAC05374]
MRFTRARVVPVAVSLATALLLGLVGPVAGKWDNPACVAVGIVFSSGWPWACYAFLMGCFRPSRIESMLLASVGLAIGVVTYYVFKDMYPTIPAGVESAAPVPAGMESGASSGGKILVWGTAAFVFGAPLGLVGNLARTPGIGGLLFRLLVPLVAFVEATQRLHVEAESQGPVFTTTWNVTRVAACVVAVALMGHTVRSRRDRRGRQHGRTEAAAPAQRL